ncbi:MAG: phospholipase [Thalassobius sp.]|nr:phospholipase [Thalassovita sp.]
MFLLANIYSALANFFRIKPAQNTFRLIKRAVLFFIFLIVSVQSFSQVLTKDSVLQLLDNSPNFTINKDNYFITGVPMNHNPTKYNSDVKFQISFRHRVTDTQLPFDTYLFLTYTQKSFWDIYQQSKPFAENNYNPGVGLGRLFFNGDKLAGAGAISLQHESNGRDSIYSRSWNRVSVHYSAILSPKAILSLTAWLPFSYGDNADLIDYIGLGEVGINWEIIKDKLIFDAIGRKGTGLDWRGSLQTNLSYKIGKSNQFLMLQCFTGYAENLVDYRVKTYMIRAGLVIKPSKFIFY